MFDDQLAHLSAQPPRSVDALSGLPFRRIVPKLALLFPLALGALAASAGHAPPSNGPIEGRVLDAQSRQPVPGAVVVAAWIRWESNIAQTNFVCPHAQMVVTAAHGRCRIGRWWHLPNPLAFLTSSPDIVEVCVPCGDDVDRVAAQHCRRAHRGDLKGALRRIAYSTRW
jgi:hypothetical protein